MASSAANSEALQSPVPLLVKAREIVRHEGRVLVELADRIGGEFTRAIDLIYACQGCVIVTGMGKAGLVGQKIAATLASTGTRSHFLHPAEAIHGDLGRVHSDDVLLALSYSGETEEIVRLLPAFKQLGAKLIAITSRASSSLGSAAEVTIPLGNLREACPLGLAPSATTTAMLALGDALALTVSEMRRFSPEDFARFHPGGSLGRKLAKVNDVMRPIGECRVALETTCLREALVAQRRPGRRTGAIMVVNDAGQLSGIFTDSDLARLLEAKRDSAIDRPISEVMTRSCSSIAFDSPLSAACDLLVGRKISELPVVDADGKPVGLVDITDIVGIVRDEPEATVADAGPAVLKLVAPPQPRRMRPRSDR
jgi:arabinose-5-phosphate isomerase